MLLRPLFAAPPHDAGRDQISEKYGGRTFF
jgi:hypothetical protein